MFIISIESGMLYFFSKSCQGGQIVGKLDLKIVINKVKRVRERAQEPGRGRDKEKG